MITKYCQITTIFETDTSLHKETNTSPNLIDNMTMYEPDGDQLSYWLIATWEYRQFTDTELQLLQAMETSHHI